MYIENYKINYSCDIILLVNRVIFQQNELIKVFCKCEFFIIKTNSILRRPQYDP